VQEIGKLQRKIRNIGHFQENRPLEPVGDFAITPTQGKNEALNKKLGPSFTGNPSDCPQKPD